MFHSNLYITDELSSIRRKVMRKLKHGKFQMGVYVITIPLGNTDMLEIYPSYVLLQKEYKKMDIQVVGLASDIDTTYLLLEKISDDCLRIRGDSNLRAYFMDDGKEM